MTSRVLLLAAAVLLAAPAAALAHGLTGDQDPHRPLIDYLWLGFKHMALGWDHLLFIAGVVLLAGTVRTAAKLISMFVLGHSLTLLVATLAGWQLDPTFVDVIIALSLVYVGVQGIRGRPEDVRLVGAIVFAFGLVHGLGLSTRLQDLGLPEGGLVERVLLFNVGVEVGQLVVLGIVFGIGGAIARRVQPRAGVARFGFAGLVAAGLIAAVVLSFPGDEDEPPRADPRPAARAENCTETADRPEPSSGGGHAEKSFYTPGEEIPEADLGHVIGDGYIIVRYREDTATADRNALATWVSKVEEGVIAAPIADQKAAVTAQTRDKRLTCSRMDLAGLTKFRDSWFRSLGVRQ